MLILQLNTSARSVGANSTSVADLITARLMQKTPEPILHLRDMASDPHPMLDEPVLNALFTQADQRSEAQHASMAQDDALISDIQNSDIIVLGVPMYNFGIPFS